MKGFIALLYNSHNNFIYLLIEIIILFLFYKILKNYIKKLLLFVILFYCILYNKI